MSGYLGSAFRPFASRYPVALRNVECGAECGPGWLPCIMPVLDLCESLGVEVVQIKEKFGGLRIYVDTAPDDVYDAIAAAELIAAKTCEDCGAPGELRRGGWYRTLCDECQVRR